MKLKLTLVKYIVALYMSLSFTWLMLTNVSSAIDLGEALKPFPYGETKNLPLVIEMADANKTQSTTFTYPMAILPPSFSSSTVIASASGVPNAPTAMAFPQVKKEPFFFLNALKKVFTHNSKPSLPTHLKNEGSHTPAKNTKTTSTKLVAMASPVAMASVNSLVPSQVILPNIWKDGKRPSPSVREQMVMRLIQATNPTWDVPSAHILARLIIDSGDANRIDYRILASLIATESSFKVNAISSTGAKGLGQLKDATAQWLGVQDAFNPIDNLNGTAKYLSYLADQFPNDPARAVASYFVGQGNVKRDGLNDSALQYIIKVQRHLDLLLSWGAN